MLSCIHKLLLAATALLLSGCATALTVDAISPGEEADDSDYVSGVTAAYRHQAGDVAVCVTGMPAGANYWISGYREYVLRYPAASTPDLKVMYHEAIPEYRVTAADVDGNCPAGRDGWTALPIHTVHAREFAREPGGETWSGMSDAKLRDFVETRAEAPAVYVFNYKSGYSDDAIDLTNIVYVGEKPVQGTARAVEIATQMRTVEGKPGYILLLPFAVVYDVVTFPLQLLAVFMHAG